jgi:hypothetical protein
MLDGAGCSGNAAENADKHRKNGNEENDSNRNNNSGIHKNSSFQDSD